MSFASMIRYARLAFFSKPVEERPIYRAMKKTDCRSVLEIGIGSEKRSLRLLEMARLRLPEEPLRYVGVDLFESSESGRAHLTILRAHQLLKAKNVQVRLLPGDPFSALGPVIYDLKPFDVVILSSEFSADSMQQAIKCFLPRLVHRHSLIFRQTQNSDGPSRFDRLGSAPLLLSDATAVRKAA